MLAACGDDGPSGNSGGLIEVVGESAVAGVPLDTVESLLSVRVTGLAGRPLSGVRITWSTDDGGSLVPESPETDESGIARAAWVLGRHPGEQEALATSGEGQVARFTASAEAFRADGLSIGDGGYQCGTVAGTLYCWVPERGDRGGSVNLPAGGDVPVAIPLEHPVRYAVTSASGFGQQFGCALTTADEVYCWGGNDVGQLGDGGSTPSQSPVQPHLPPGPYKHLSTSDGGVCAISAAGDAYCWGDNRLGRFGLGHEESPVPTPARVPVDFPWGHFSLGFDRACGVREGGQVYCWGASPASHGTDVDTSTVLPLPVLNSPPMDSVTLSGWHQCGITASRETHCWGENFNIGFRSADLVIPYPMPLESPPTFQSVHSAFKPTFALGTDGRGYWWGPPPFSTGGGPESPEALVGDIPLRAIGTNEAGVCGVEEETGTVYCWAQSSIFELALLTAVPPVPSASAGR
jgi:hypothetical protein